MPVGRIHCRKRIPNCLKSRRRRKIGMARRYGAALGRCRRQGWPLTVGDFRGLLWRRSPRFGIPASRIEITLLVVPAVFWRGRRHRCRPCFGDRLEEVAFDLALGAVFAWESAIALREIRISVIGHPRSAAFILSVSSSCSSRTPERRGCDSLQRPSDAPWRWGRGRSETPSEGRAGSWPSDVELSFRITRASCP